MISCPKSQWRRPVFFLFILFLTCGCVFPIENAHAAAGIYRTIHFQGKVVNADGTNVTNASYPFTFALYTAGTGGTQLWTENQTLSVTDGIFRAPLGSVTSFSGSVDFNTDNLFLGINFNADGEMSPRVRFTAVPYALNAEKVAGLTVTNTTGTLTVQNTKTISFGDTFTTSGAYPLTLTVTGTTNATIPTGTVTLVDTATAQTLTNKTVGSTGLVFSGAATDIDTAAGEALNLQGRATSTLTTTAGNILLSPAGNVGVGTGSPGSKLDVNGTVTATGYTGAGLSGCSAANSKLLWTGGNFSCGIDNANPQNVKITSESSADNVSASETSLGIPVTITPSSGANRILLNGFVHVVGTGTNNINVTIRVRRGTLVSSPLVVETKCGFSDPVSATCTWTAVDNPATTSPVTYTVFALGTSAVGTMTNKSSMAMEVSLGADIAELYSTLDSTIAMGDVVSIEPGLVSGVRKTTRPYDDQALGIVSTRPALVVGAGEEQGVKSVPVALSGRVPVKVSTENGVIRSGDYLTSSSVAGVAMRADRPGPVIGQALSSYEGADMGTVVAFVKNGFYGGSTASAGVRQPDLSGPLLLRRMLEQDPQRFERQRSGPFLTDGVEGLAVASLGVTTADPEIHAIVPDVTYGVRMIQGDDGRMQFVNADTHAVIWFNEKGDGMFSGKLTVGEIDAKYITGSFATAPTFPSDMAGFAQITAGADSVDVTFEQAYRSMPIVTASMAIDQTNFTEERTDEVKAAVSRILADQPAFLVTHRTTRGFRIRLNRPATDDLLFSWVALSVQNPTLSRSTFIPSPTVTAQPSPMPTVSVPISMSPTPTIVSPSPFPSTATEATTAGQTEYTVAEPERR